MAAMCNLALAQEWEAAVEIDARLSDLNPIVVQRSEPDSGKVGDGAPGHDRGGYPLAVDPSF